MMEEKRGKIVAAISLVFFIYLFIFSLVLIKSSMAGFGGIIFKIAGSNTREINAVGIGWFVTLIMQSGGAAISALIALGAAGIIAQHALIYMVLGTRIGAAISYLLVSVMVNAKRRDFRHGFEVALVNLVYVFPVVLIMFFFEYFFDLFSKTGNYFIALEIPFKINFLEHITLPVIKIFSFLPSYVLVLIGVFALILSLKKIPKSVLSLWSRNYLNNKLNRYMKKKSYSFFMGFLFTLLLFSTSITVSFLIPLVVMRVINLKKTIPYIIGAHLGGVIDVILAGLVIGDFSLPTIFTYVGFSVIGLLWLFNTELLFDITKYVSKKTLHVSRKRALLFVLFFVFLAIFLTFL